MSTDDPARARLAGAGAHSPTELSQVTPPPTDSGSNASASTSASCGKVFPCHHTSESATGSGPVTRDEFSRLQLQVIAMSQRLTELLAERQQPQAASASASATGSASGCLPASATASASGSASASASSTEASPVAPQPPMPAPPAPISSYVSCSDVDAEDDARLLALATSARRRSGSAGAAARESEQPSRVDLMLVPNQAHHVPASAAASSSVSASASLPDVDSEDSAFQLREAVRGNDAAKLRRLLKCAADVEVANEVRVADCARCALLMHAMMSCSAQWLW